MSHFTVGVLSNKNGEDLKELLDPYQENNMGDCPKEYLEFNECDKEDIEEYEEYKNEYETLDQFMEKYHGYRKNEETGKYGYWENPNAKWDWYTVGGRWSNKILTKDGERVDYAKLKDIDWVGMTEKSRKKAQSIWDSNPEGFERYLNGIHKDDTKESYIKRESEFKTFAVITPDGEWHEKGDMGWFGCSSETEDEAKEWDLSYYDKFIKNADQELMLIIVDCHI
ncbi:hypothetical protein DP122_00325 [Clostridium tetani]|uniref:hypothetical protein n=1 Tax=Clostridium tetani TaxID=1513 RepID=UPI00100C268E|nr:hypothetical protein [Clostridium tetani]RXI57262.1 hypothetical protein DP122_00325 [Clostridium tetani]